ncbi:hypothetical protein CF328_g1567 [Tilletia controversa]|nr:hypothetical protein CF328_g1567 [Tilletia controversa]
MTNARESVITAFSNFAPDKQEQSLPGLDKDLKPGAAHFQVEKWDENGKPYLEEYKGNHRLFVERDNKPKNCDHHRRRQRDRTGGRHRICAGGSLCDDCASS